MLALASIGLFSFQLAGCVSTYFVPIESTSDVDLGPDEALLVLQIDSDLPLQRLILSDLYIKRSVSAGEHLWIAKVRPGPLSWQYVVVAGSGPYDGRYRIVRSRYARPGELDLTIEAGAINYVGELIVRKASFGGGRAWISLRVRNHAAMALRTLEHEHAELLDAFPVRTAVSSGDAFLEFYAAERERIRLQSESAPDTRSAADGGPADDGDSVADVGGDAGNGRVSDDERADGEGGSP